MRFRRKEAARFARLYAETARHPDNLALLNELGAYFTTEARGIPAKRTRYSWQGGDDLTPPGKETPRV